MSLLEWSPDGCYLLAGSADGSFRIWETQKWTSAAWSTQARQTHLLCFPPAFVSPLPDLDTSKQTASHQLCMKELNSRSDPLRTWQSSSAS